MKHSINHRLTLIASSTAALLLLAGCASTDGISTQAHPLQANTLAAATTLGATTTITTTAASSWPRSDWWKQFNDSQLDQLIAEALAGNPGLRVAEARARKALALSQSADAARYPQLNANAQFQRERFPEHSLVPPPYAGSIETQAQLQATLNYDLDLWHRNQAAYASAMGQAKAAEIDASAARLALSVSVAQTYVQLERAYLQRDVAEQMLKQREQLHALTRDRYDAGLDTLLAVKQTESALPAAREQIAQLDETIALTRNQLAALTGQGPDRGLAITRPQASVLAQANLPTTLPAELIGRRPDVLAQRWRIEAARRDIDVAKAEFYPNINLAAFVGLQSIGLPDLTQSRTAGIGPAISLPIFDAGRLRANLGGKSADYDAAVETYNQTVLEALRDVVDQVAIVRSLNEQSKQQQLALATTQAAYTLALQRFREGIGNYLEVLTAESQLLAQQSLDVDLRARSMSVAINLSRALGGGYSAAAPALAAN